MKKFLAVAGALTMVAHGVLGQEFKPAQLWERASLEEHMMQEEPLDPAVFEPAPAQVKERGARGLDWNEGGPGLARLYNLARRDFVRGNLRGAEARLRAALEQFPESRHLHQKLAELSFYRYKDLDGGPGALDTAGREALQAARIGLSIGIMDDTLLDLFALTHGIQGNIRELDRFFGTLIEREPTSRHFLYYARGLALADEPGAEFAFQKALALDPGGDALAGYGEWLLDHGRYNEVLDIVPAEAHEYYLHFLRGAAWEHLDNLGEAAREYHRFAAYSLVFPAPARFFIPGSAAQSKLRFEDRATRSPGPLSPITAALTATQSVDGLSYLVTGEAGGENTGGRRGVAWIVRSRALRGAVASIPAGGSSAEFCPGASNSGATLADQYKSVMCAGIGTSGEQFNGMCDAWCSNENTTSCTANSGTRTVALDVYNGNDPDPVSGHCPGGWTSVDTNRCNDAMTCYGYTDTYKVSGPLFNFGTSGSCPAEAGGCTVTDLVGKTCGNGGSDNCFYRHSAYGTTSSTTYTCSIASQGAACVSGTLTNGGTYRGHLEGPEGAKTGIDFELYLQRFNTSTSQWENVSSSTRFGAVEDVSSSVASGSYRWRVLALTGSGSFTLYAKNP